MTAAVQEARNLEHFRGRHHGVVVHTDAGMIEVTIYDRGMPPRFNLFFYDPQGGLTLPPVGVTLEVQRPGGERETYRFTRHGHSLEATTDVQGPHDFQIRLSVPQEGSMHVHDVRFTRRGGEVEHAEAPQRRAPAPWIARLREAMSPVLGRRRRAATAVSGRVSALLLAAAREQTTEVMKMLETSPAGLRDNEVRRRAEQYGVNEVGQETAHGPLQRLIGAVTNPLVILLTALAIISFVTDDKPGGTVMSLMVLVAVTLRLVQETRADNAAARLRAMIRVTATVTRNEKAIEVPLRDLVPGDVVKLAAGDMIPADVRIVSAKDLFVTQASLTGESIPVEKTDTLDRRGAVAPLELSNVAFLGTSVESGTATAVVASVGQGTYLGSLAEGMAASGEATSFDRGVNRFTWLMIQFMAVMVPTVFVINGLTKHDWKEAFFFALAVAVGLTPEMLPMIVSVGLSKGALLMSRNKVIVKRLSAIQNFGAMDVLCTDKTGTLTMDHVVLEKYCDVVRRENEEVLLHAYTISHFQTGLRNVLDRAILNHKNLQPDIASGQMEKVDEIPFDFVRRMMSVVVKSGDGKYRLLAKGAPEEIYRRCTHFELDGEVEAMDPLVLEDLRQEYNTLSSDGFRVLAVAYRDLPERAAYSKSDESELVLKGYVAFLDPPKESAAKAIEALSRHGVAVKVLTGDNDLVARKVCRDVGLDVGHVVLGVDVEGMNEEELIAAASSATLFARLSPAHKRRIVKALQSRQHVVGFMGDGINDSPALRAADVGISVDTAVDIAKESADLILLEKDLMVLEQGVVEGRRVFVNILKYIRMGASSNFGNMFSVLGASAFLPFLPMAPIQVLANNMLYDFSQVPIPTDCVDEEQITHPRPWNIEEIKRFILFMGPISSIFDYTTFAVMIWVFHAGKNESLFQTGWFVESLMTQTLIIHVIRTNKIPFIQSRASWSLILTSLAIMGVGALLPFSPLAKPLGLQALPPLYWPILLATLVSYVVVTQLIKVWLLRRKWI